MTDAARWVTEKIQGFIEETTTPELQASWYRERFDGMAALGVGLAVLVALIALGSAAMRRDSDAMGATFIGMFRAGIGTGIVLAITVMALSVADGITNWVAADAAGKEAAAFWGDVSTAWDGGDSAGFGSSAIAFVFALVQVLAGLAVWLELLVRSAAIYVAVLFMPMALAAGIWPKLQAWQTRLGEPAFHHDRDEAGDRRRALVGGIGSCSWGGRRQGLRDPRRRGDDPRPRGVRAVGADDAHQHGRRELVDRSPGRWQHEGRRRRRNGPSRRRAR